MSEFCNQRLSDDSIAILKILAHVSKGGKLALELSTTHIRLWVFGLWLFEPE